MSQDYLAYVQGHRQKEIMDLVALIPYLRLKDGLPDDIERRQKVMLMIVTIHGIVKLIGSVAKGPAEIRQMMNVQMQDQILRSVREESERLLAEMEWLSIKVKEIWHEILKFGTLEPYLKKVINKETGQSEKRVVPIKIDLKFLIKLESEGYKVLKYYKNLWNNNPNSVHTSVYSKNTEIASQLDAQQ